MANKKKKDKIQIKKWWFGQSQVIFRPSFSSKQQTPGKKKNEA